MIRILLQLTAVLVVLSPTTVLADYGDLWITGAVLSQGKPIQGRLEFEDRNGVWGTVCDVGFTERAGNVACKQLGFVRVEKVLYKQFGNQSRLPFTICATECTGKESRLSQCQLKSCKDSALYQLPCKKENVVGIQCTNLPNPIAEVKGDNLEVGSGVGNVNEIGNPIDDEDDDDTVNDHGDGSGGSVGNVNNTHVDNDHNNNDQDDNTGVVTSPEDTDDNQDNERTDVSLPKLSDGTIDNNDPSDEIDEDQNGHNIESIDSRSDRRHSDDSISSGAILGIVLSCLFVVAVILFVLGIVLWGYRRHHGNFVVTQDYPRILVASGMATTTTKIPKSYMQSSRLTPKGYEALPVTDYVPVQPVIKKPVY